MIIIVWDNLYIEFESLKTLPNNNRNCNYLDQGAIHSVKHLRLRISSDIGMYCVLGRSPPCFLKATRRTVHHTARHATILGLFFYSKHKTLVMWHNIFSKLSKHAVLWKNGLQEHEESCLTDAAEDSANTSAS